MSQNTTTRKPTTEQQAIIDAALTGGNLIIQAGAGTGKTSTLLLIAEALPTKKILGIAFNKSIVLENTARSPKHLTWKTSHSLAFGAVGRKYADRVFNKKRMPGKQVASILGAPSIVFDEDTRLTPVQVARIARETVNHYCYSADLVIGQEHVPFQNGIRGAAHAKLKTTVLPLARKYWEDVQNVHGVLPFTHDYYLKMWALTKPRINADVIFLDEAQDTNPLLAALVQNQTHAQQIVVGDGCQQMYGWRGATDALATWPNAEELFLTQSWRFGEAIAQEANSWLAQLDTPMRLSGNPGINSVLAPVDGTPDAVLCRTNGGAMGEVMSLIAEGAKVALVGGGDTLTQLAEAAVELMAGRQTWHPELAAFSSWQAVRDFAEEDGKDLRTFVKLIDDHGPEGIISATKALVGEEQATVTVSTAHKSKGREWDAVRLAGDYFLPKEGEDMATSEIMICYVAVTRAKKVLDCSALAVN